MTLSLLLIAVVMLIAEHMQQAVATCDAGLRYEVHHNKSMVADAVIMELQTRTEFECVSECRFRQSCVSVNVRKSETTRLNCTGFSVTVADEGAVLREEEGTSYIEHHPENEEDEDCETKMEEGSTSSGVYNLVRKMGEVIVAHCDMATGTGGWIIIQRRMDGSLDFYRGWQEYKDGFGFLSGEFWLGLDRIHDLTKSGEYTLRFDLWDDTEHRFAEYKNATVADEADNYRLDYASYTGTAGDSMTFMSKGRAFTTYDKDNDEGQGSNCAQTYKGAWWYASCHEANLNGLYLNGSTTQYATGMVWYQFRGHQYSLLRTEIKVKRMSCPPLHGLAQQITTIPGPTTQCSLRHSSPLGPFGRLR